MKRILYLSLLLSAAPMALGAQSSPIITNDPAIVTGKTSNGLTYYLVKDARDRGFADFFMVQKCGTSVEDSTQKGMTALLADMNIRHTRGYPEGGLFDMLSGQGVISDRSLVRHIGENEVILGLTDIPVGSSSAVMDEALTALLNMCSGAELESGSGFGDGYDIREIRKFRERWFRCDLQAIVITGDIDINSVRDKISLLSRSMPRDAGATEYPEASAPEQIPSGISYSAGTDPDADAATLRIDIMQSPMAPDRRNSPVALVQDYLKSIMCDMLSARIRRLSPTWPLPVDSFDVTMGAPCDGMESEGISISLSTTPGHLSDAAGCLSAMLDNFRHGVGEHEFAASSYRYKCTSGDLVSRWTPVRAGHYAEGCFRHFLHGYPLPSAEEKDRNISRLYAALTVEKINEYIDSFMNDGTYMSVHAVTPCAISEAEIAEAFTEGPSKFSSGTGAVPSSPMPAPGSSRVRIKSPVTEPITGSLCYTLPSNAKVFFRKADAEPGQVSVVAVSRGGLSLSDRTCTFLSGHINDVAPLSLPVTPDSSTVSLRREFTPDRAYLRGECRTDELETLFSMMRESFLTSDIDTSAFRRRMEVLTMSDAWGYGSSSDRLEKRLSDAVIVKGDHTPPDCAAAAGFISKCFSNIGSFNIFIAGDCSADEVKDMLERYLAPLTGRRVQQAPRPGTFSFSSIPVRISDTVRTESPVHRYGIRLLGDYQYSLSGVMKAEVISSIIRQEISGQMMKEGVEVTTRSELFRYPAEKTSVEAVASSREKAAYLEEAIDEILEALTENGVADDRIEMTKKYVLNSLLRDESSDRTFWISMMEARSNGKDFYSGREAAMAEITPAEINSSLKSLLKNAVRTSVAITPEGTEVPELPAPEYQDPFEIPFDLSLDLTSLLSSGEDESEIEEEETMSEDTAGEDAGGQTQP